MICLSLLVSQLQHRAPSPSELLPPHLVVKKLCHGHTHTLQLSAGRLSLTLRVRTTGVLRRFVYTTIEGPRDLCWRPET
jgi:hypothetical protein